MLNMIDTSLTREQFRAFPMEIALRLLNAAESDIVEWSDRLIAAWNGGDKDEAQRARHSLKGLCGNFGAVKLLEVAEQDLSSPKRRKRS